MSADLIKEKIAQAVEKINNLKEELKLHKTESENLQIKVTELHASNLELNDRIQKLEAEKHNIAENNTSAVKEIEDRLSMLTDLLDLDDQDKQAESSEKPQQAEQEHFF